MFPVSWLASYYRYIRLFAPSRGENHWFLFISNFRLIMCLVCPLRLINWHNEIKVKLIDSLRINVSRSQLCCFRPNDRKTRHLGLVRRSWFIPRKERNKQPTRKPFFEVKKFAQRVAESFKGRSYCWITTIFLFLYVK